MKLIINFALIELFLPFQKDDLHVQKAQYVQACSCVLVSSAIIVCWCRWCSVVAYSLVIVFSARVMYDARNHCVALDL